MRMCAVTLEKKPKNELLRFVLIAKENRVQLDEGDRLRGRGLNMKPDIDVFEKGLKLKIFERKFNIKLSNEEIEKLRNSVKESINKKFTEKVVVRITEEEFKKLKNE